MDAMDVLRRLVGGLAFFAFLALLLMRYRSGRDVFMAIATAPTRRARVKALAPVAAFLGVATIEVAAPADIARILSGLWLSGCFFAFVWIACHGDELAEKAASAEDVGRQDGRTEPSAWYSIVMFAGAFFFFFFMPF